MKILVVDDEKDVEVLFRQKFRKELRRGDFELLFAFSAKEALDLLNHDSPPEVVYVFSDINMPGMSGLELLDIIKKDYSGISVSMISAYGDKENYEKAIHSGAKEFFTKPIDFNVLKDEITKLLESS